MRLSVLVAGLVLGVGTLAVAGGTPDQKCTASKLKATGKRAAADLKCHAKATKKNLGVDPSCTGKADDKFTAAFGKADAKGGCPGAADPNAIADMSDMFVADVVAALPDGGTDDGRACAAIKLAATGKKAGSKLGCEAKAAGQGGQVDPTCTGAAETKFSAAFAKAESKGGCAVGDPNTSDPNAIESTVDTFVADVVAALTPAPVSFAADVQPIFTANCTTCHSGGAPPAGLDLSAGNAYADTVNVASFEMATLDRVLPGDAANSYLVRKINGGPGISGSQMPLAAPPLSSTDIGTITNWIIQGALNN